MGEDLLIYPSTFCSTSGRTQVRPCQHRLMIKHQFNRSPLLLKKYSVGSTGYTYRSTIIYNRETYSTFFKKCDVALLHKVVLHHVSLGLFAWRFKWDHQLTFLVTWPDYCCITNCWCLTDRMSSLESEHSTLVAVWFISEVCSRSSRLRFGYHYNACVGWMIQGWI